jgi:hypothetical protein
MNQDDYSAFWNMGLDFDVLYSNKTYLINFDNYTFLGIYS